MTPHLHGAHARHPMPPPDRHSTPGFTGPARPAPPADRVVRHILAWRGTPRATFAQPSIPLARGVLLGIILGVLLGLGTWALTAHPRAEIARVTEAARAAR